MSTKNQLLIVFPYHGKLRNELVFLYYQRFTSPV